MDNEIVVCIYTVEFYLVIKTNKIMTFVRKWMELENIILSEVMCPESQKQHVVFHMQILASNS